MEYQGGILGADSKIQSKNEKKYKRLEFFSLSKLFGCILKSQVPVPPWRDQWQQDSPSPCTHGGGWGMFPPLGSHCLGRGRSSACNLLSNI